MSRFEFKLPDIGEGVTEGEVVNWLVAEGDMVTDDQEMVEVMTDKATVTIGAPKAGKVVEIVGKSGDVVPVGSVLVVLDTDAKAGEKTPPSKPKDEGTEARSAKDNGGAASQPSPDSSSGQRKEPTATAVGDLKEDLPGMDSGEVVNEKPLAAPATRKLARELGVDLRRVTASGPGGRITREDVERFKGNGAPSSARAESAGESRRSTTIHPAPPSARGPGAGQADERIPIRGLRKRIYENMARAKRTAAHFTYVDECDVTELKQVRSRVKEHAAASGVALTFLPFIVKAVVAALKRHPALNCVVDDDKMELILRGTFDIGIAVATDSGLTVPVLRGADRRSMLDIQKEIERLSGEARAGKTQRQDLGGSSFTITSLGKQGGLFATPIVNYPEVAILGVHEMKRRPVVRGDQIVIGDVMLLSLSFDHRIIDGHMGAAFARDVIDYLQSPDKLLVELA